MAKKKETVTNAMRWLKNSKIAFETVLYETEEVGCDFGEKISELTGIPPEMSFKTLVARGDRNGIAVVCIPVKHEIDLKKLAQVTGNKRAELIQVKELLSLTGYIRGGVSPIGMKKQYPTYVDAEGEKLDKVAVSGGCCGVTLIMTPQELQKATGCKFVDLISEKGRCE